MKYWFARGVAGHDELTVMNSGLLNHIYVYFYLDFRICWFHVSNVFLTLTTEPVEGPRTAGWGEGGLTYAQGPHVRYGTNFLGACRCM